MLLIVIFIKESPPKIQFEEGESASSIYVVPSLGIDPATGQDILVKKDGSLTFVYDANDKVAMGNTIPKLELALSTSFSYKGFSMFAGMSITVEDGSIILLVLIR